jgi:hypothetical protein
MDGQNWPLIRRGKSCENKKHRELSKFLAYSFNLCGRRQDLQIGSMKESSRGVSLKES